MTRAKPKPKRKSGPSGKGLVPRQTVRVPEEIWAAFGELCAARGTDRSKAINALIVRELSSNP